VKTNIFTTLLQNEKNLTSSNSALKFTVFWECPFSILQTGGGRKDKQKKTDRGREGGREGKKIEA